MQDFENEQLIYSYAVLENHIRKEYKTNLYKIIY